MHKVPWPCPVVRYALCGDSMVAQSAHDYVLVREVVPSVHATRLRELNEAHDALQAKLLHCPFIVLEWPGGRCEAYSASGTLPDFSLDQCPLLDAELNAEHNCVYVNLNTHVTTYAESGHLLHAERVHCVTSCLPRCFHASDAPTVLQHLRQIHARTVERQCRSARLLVEHEQGKFFYLNGADFSIMKQLP